MDPDIVSGLAAFLGVTTITVGALMVLSRTRLGEAIARRIAGDGPGRETQEQLEALEEEVASLRAQLSETGERLDFAERLLTRAEESRPPS